MTLLITPQELMDAVKNGGYKGLGYEYFVEVQPRTLFNPGWAKLRKYAHADSMNDHQTLKVVEYERRHEVIEDLFAIVDPIETIWGDF